MRTVKPNWPLNLCSCVNENGGTLLHSKNVPRWREATVVNYLWDNPVCRKQMKLINLIYLALILVSLGPIDNLTHLVRQVLEKVDSLGPIGAWTNWITWSDWCLYKLTFLVRLVVKQLDCCGCKLAKWYISNRWYNGGTGTLGENGRLARMPVKVMLCYNLPWNIHSWSDGWFLGGGTY